MKNNNNIIKTLQVNLDYDLCVSLKEHNKNLGNYYLPATHYQSYGVININNPDVITSLIESSKNNNYTLFYKLLDSFLNTQGTNLISFLESYYKADEYLEEGIFDLI